MQERLVCKQEVKFMLGRVSFRVGVTGMISVRVCVSVRLQGGLVCRGFKVGITLSSEI